MVSQLLVQKRFPRELLYLTGFSGRMLIANLSFMLSPLLQVEFVNFLVEMSV